MPVSRTHQIPQVYYRFKVSNQHAKPENILHVIFNKTCLNRLGWPPETRVKIFIPLDFEWNIFLIPHKNGYKYSNYKEKVFFRFKWDSGLKNPKSYMYTSQKIPLIKGAYGGKNVCVLNMSKNQSAK